MNMILFTGINYDSGLPLSVAISEATPLELKPHDEPSKTLVIIPHFKILVDKTLADIVLELDNAKKPKKKSE